MCIRDRSWWDLVIFPLPYPFCVNANILSVLENNLMSFSPYVTINLEFLQGELWSYILHHLKTSTTPYPSWTITHNPHEPSTAFTSSKSSCVSLITWHLPSRSPLLANPPTLKPSNVKISPSPPTNLYLLQPKIPTSHIFTSIINLPFQPSASIPHAVTLPLHALMKTLSLTYSLVSVHRHLTKVRTQLPSNVWNYRR